MKYLVVAVMLFLPVHAYGQNQTTFRDSRGSTTGTATTNGNTTVFRDSRGSTTGTATRDSQGNTTFRDSRGSTTGSASTPGFLRQH
jgi:hypothetical protein